MANGVRLGLVAVLSLGLTAGTGLLGLAGAQTPWTAPASEKGRENPLPADAKTVA